jgi:hypothetical protein
MPNILSDSILAVNALAKKIAPFSFFLAGETQPAP